MVIFIGVLVIVLIFCLLLQQSRKPSGVLGRLMMSLWNRTYEPMVKWSLAQEPLVGVEQVLDIGVGNGLSTDRLSQLLPNVTCLGVDYAPDAIKVARQNYPELQFQVADVTVLPFKEESFQLVTAFQTHFHWHDLNKGLGECYRVLAQEGQLLLTCERSKVSYYLKEQLDPQKAKAYFESFGFVNVRIKEQGPWLSYYMQKK